MNCLLVMIKYLFVANVLLYLLVKKNYCSTTSL